MGKYELLATAGISINMISFFTLLQRIHETKNTSSLSWYYLLGIILAQILFLIYGYVNSAYGILYPTIILFIGLLYIAYIKFIYTEEVLERMKKEQQQQ
jgi:uncharacterized protein with PQ loop repeat